jgi:hypothetical protein
MEFGLSEQAIRFLLPESFVPSPPILVDAGKLEAGL